MKLSLLLSFLFAAAFAQQDVVIIYQNLASPTISLSTESQALEASTGTRITWINSGSGFRSIAAVDNGWVDLAVSGSSPCAQAAARNSSGYVWYIVDQISESESLCTNPEKVPNPAALRGSTIGVPFGSTTHYHLLFAFELFGIPFDEVTAVDMSPGAMQDAFESGQIDGAFVWVPVLANLNGAGCKNILSSFTLGNWGKPTFDGFYGVRSFIDNNANFMAELVLAHDDIIEDWNKNRPTYTNDSPEVKKYEKYLGSIDILAALDSNTHLNLETQTAADCIWFGPPEGCPGLNGVAKALQQTAEFLESQKVHGPSKVGNYADAVSTAPVHDALVLKNLRKK